MNVTTKHKGDACEMLVAAELTFADVPAMRMPDNWPHYDVIAQPEEGPPQRISVKGRSWKVGGLDYVDYQHGGDFDWLAAVIIMPPTEDKEYQRCIFVIPRAIFEERAKKASPSAKRDDWRCPIDRMLDIFPEYQDNFSLSWTGRPIG